MSVAMTKYIYDYPMQSVTADILVVLPNTEIEDSLILLIERKNEPYKGKFCLPGGFMEQNELLVECAARELYEETSININVGRLRLITILDNPNRDPRGRVIANVFEVNITEEEYNQAKANDDAASIKWVKLSDILIGKVELGFDHKIAIEKLINLMICD